MLAELLLTPVELPRAILTSEHDQVVAYVENELSNPATTLIYIDERGLQHFHQLMTFKRPVGTLPQRHLFCLKWLRMMQFSGILLRLTGPEDHEKILAQMFVGILHADGKASVTFENTRRGGSWWEENLRSMQEKCLDYFTPSFDDVFSETVEMIKNLAQALPQSAMADYGIRHLKGGASGWATSR